VFGSVEMGLQGGCLTGRKPEEANAEAGAFGEDGGWCDGGGGRESHRSFGEASAV
jgi:hypothetical protein